MLTHHFTYPRSFLLHYCPLRGGLPIVLLFGASDWVNQTVPLSYMKQNTTQIKYFLYRRKSTDDERQVLSLSAQEEEVSRKFPNIKLIKLPPESVSAFKPDKRPVFKDMIERIKKGEAQGIVAYHPDRLSRNAMDAAEVIYLLDRGLLKDLKFCTYHFDNGPEGKMMLNITMSQSKYSSDKLSVDVARGMGKKAKIGWRPGLIPIGYKNSKDRPQGEQIIFTDPKRFNLVRDLWQKMLTGNYTVPQLFKIANEEMKLTQSATPSRPERPLHLSTLYRVFTNPFYYGQYEWPKGSGEWNRGNHKSMITEDEFDRVQYILGRKGKPRPKEHKFAFTGLVKCGSCGSSITAEEKFKKQKNGNVHHYIYYRCTKKLSYKIGVKCPEKYIEIKELEKYVDQEIINKLTISDKFLEWGLKYLHEIRKDEAVAQEDILASKQTRYEKIIKEIDKLALTYTSPDNTDEELMDKEQYTRLRSQLLKEKTTLEKDLEGIGKEVENWLDLTERSFNFVRYARIWFEKGDLDTKRAIFACLGSNFILEDRKVAIELKKPFKFIFEARDLAEQELARLEPAKYASIKGKTEDFASEFPVLSG